jgi:hypothetical protein
MPSSTLRHASSERRGVAFAFTAIIGAPFVWFALLQTNYVLAYQACADRSNVWLHVPSAAALLLSLVLIGVAIVAWRHVRNAAVPGGLLGMFGLLLAGGFFVLTIATAIPPLILHPCDF